MEEEIETMLGIQAGITVILASLISTHPDYEKLQLQISRIFEHVAPKVLWPTMTARQRTAAEKYVQFLQQIKEVPGEIDPLSQLGFRRPPR